MNFLLSVGVSIVFFSIVCFLNGILDYLEKNFGPLNLNISTDRDSVSIVSSESFYSNLLVFIFESKRN